MRVGHTRLEELDRLATGHDHAAAAPGDQQRGVAVCIDREDLRVGGGEDRAARREIGVRRRQDEIVAGLEGAPATDEAEDGRPADGCPIDEVEPASASISGTAASAEHDSQSAPPRAK